MKSKLVLYSQGNKGQFKDFPDKDNCTFVNTKYSDLKGIIQGMRFTELYLNDNGVNKEDTLHAEEHIVSEDLFKIYVEVMSTGLTDVGKCLVSLTTKGTGG